MKLPSGATWRSLICAMSTAKRRVFGTRAASDCEEVACAGVGRGVPELRHRPGLDLADALAREVEELTHLFERSGLTPIQAEAQGQDLTLPLVERREELLDLVGEQGGCRDLERRLGGA